MFSGPLVTMILYAIVLIRRSSFDDSACNWSAQLLGIQIDLGFDICNKTVVNYLEQHDNIELWKEIVFTDESGSDNSDVNRR